jgi:hypothetical protein
MDKIVLDELKKLKNVYQDVTEVDLGPDLKLKMKIITSEEETEVHASAMKHEKGLSYLYSIKRETLCRAIIHLNGHDLPDFIETEDEKLERYQFLRQNIVKGWSQVMVDEIWGHYNLLSQSVEQRILGSIQEETEETQEGEETTKENEE